MSFGVRQQRAARHDHSPGAVESPLAQFEPELPVELTDAVYAVWQRAVERSRGWAP